MIARIWADGYRLALIKVGRKWGYYVTLETPIRVRRVRISRFSYTVLDDPTLLARFKAGLTDLHSRFGGTKGALKLINKVS